MRQQQNMDFEVLKTSKVIIRYHIIMDLALPTTLGNPTPGKSGTLTTQQTFVDRSQFLSLYYLITQQFHIRHKLF